MLKVLILQAMHALSDERAEFLIKDRLSFMRFLGLGLADRHPVPAVRRGTAFGGLPLQYTAATALHVSHLTCSALPRLLVEAHGELRTEKIGERRKVLRLRYVSKRPIWFGDAAAPEAALPSTIHRIAGA